MSAHPQGVAIHRTPRRMRTAAPRVEGPAAAGQLTALAQSEHRYFALVEACGQAILIESEGEIVFANAAAAELFAIQSFRDLLGKRLQDLIPSFGGARPPGEAEAGSSRFKRHVLARTDGVGFEVEIAADACNYVGRGAVQIVLRAARDRDPIRRRDNLALPDAHTGVPGRILFRDRVAGAIAAADRNGQLLAVMIIGVDSLQSMNALHGREEAESALREIASRMIQGLRKSDVIVSVGPYEYAILVESLGERAIAAMLAQRMLEAVSRPILPGSKEACVTASIGISVFSREVCDASELIANADRALFAARKAGGNNFQFYSGALEHEAGHDAARRSETLKRLEQLTPREHQVLDMLVNGSSSKMIAYSLGTSARTIDAHRARVMEKMQADSLASLVTMIVDTRT